MGAREKERTDEKGPAEEKRGVYGLTCLCGPEVKKAAWVGTGRTMVLRPVSQAFVIL